jgi:hypothetical protein
LILSTGAYGEDKTDMQCEVVDPKEEDVRRETLDMGGRWKTCRRDEQGD